MKIDIFAHVLPQKYFATLSKKVDLKDYNLVKSRAVNSRGLSDLEMRLKLMDRYPDVLQVVTISLPPLETVLPPADALELSKIANDELAELVIKYPDKFIAGVACLPLNDIDAAIKEAERAITQLGLKGIQVFARVNGDTLDDPKFKPLFAKMAQYDLPIWIHCSSDELLDESLFGWPFSTSSAMRCLVTAGVFHDFPDIKFITHHCGAMVPYFADRIKWLFPQKFKQSDPARNWGDHFSKFYTDTAMYGSTPALMCGHAFFGTTHMLFGTDAPSGPQWGLTQETIDSINRMEIPEADKEKIFYRNAVQLLKIAI